MPEPGPDDTAPAPSRSRRRRKHRSWARRRHLGLLTTGVAALILVAGVLAVVATWDSGRAGITGQIAAAESSAATVAPATGSATGTSGRTSTAPSAGATPTPSGTSGTSGTGQLSGVRGAITAVGDETWTLAGANGVTYTIIVTSTTTYSGRRSFGSFVVGDTVAVKGTLDQGTVTAATVSPANPAS